jgi:hypothetical protein
MTSSGVEAAIFRLVTQSLNQLRYLVPHNPYRKILIFLSCLKFEYIDREREVRKHKRREG